jgi:hypothetical protein
VPVAAKLRAEVERLRAVDMAPPSGLDDAGDFEERPWPNSKVAIR